MCYLVRHVIPFFHSHNANSGGVHESWSDYRFHWTVSYHNGSEAEVWPRDHVECPPQQLHVVLPCEYGGQFLDFVATGLVYSSSPRSSSLPHYSCARRLSPSLLATLSLDEASVALNTPPVLLHFPFVRPVGSWYGRAVLRCFDSIYLVAPIIYSFVIVIALDLVFSLKQRLI